MRTAEDSLDGKRTANTDKRPGDCAQAAETKRQTWKKRLFTRAVHCRIIFLFALAYNRRKDPNFENKVMEVEMRHSVHRWTPFFSNALHSINN